ncbi:hypothetical protein SDC9_175851 [bioreactor metagenome]|uniref:Uncharacterized protein n=1 Tax=bioreactor metagenome TaxID=1076179 RepID=A0A645GQA5_9ZZZZ
MRKRNRQFAGRVQPAKHRFRNGLTAKHAAVEGDHDRVRPFRHAGKAERLCRNQHRYDRSIQRLQTQEQLFLFAGKRKIRAVAEFPRLLHAVAQNEQNRAAIPRRLRRRVQIVLRRFEHAAAARVNDLRAGRFRKRSNTLQHRHIRAYGRMLRVRHGMRKIGPVAILRADVVRVRADDGNLLQC